MARNKVSKSLLHVLIGSLLKLRERLVVNIDLLAFSTKPFLEIAKLLFVLKAECKGKGTVRPYQLECRLKRKRIYHVLICGFVYA